MTLPPARSLDLDLPDYQLAELPRDAAGEPLYADSSHESYLAYVEWLADHLPQVHGEPRPWQAKLCQVARTSTPEWAVDCIAMEAAFHYHDSGAVELAVWDTNLTLEEARRNPARILPALHDRLGLDSEDDEPAPGAPAVAYSVSCTPPATVEHAIAILDRLIERDQQCGQWANECADLGWRTPLALALTPVADRARRIELIRSFFTTYHEYLRK